MGVANSKRARPLGSAPAMQSAGRALLARGLVIRKQAGVVAVSTVHWISKER